MEEAGSVGSAPSIPSAPVDTTPAQAPEAPSAPAAPAPSQTGFSDQSDFTDRSGGSTPSLTGGGLPGSDVGAAPYGGSPRSAPDPSWSQPGAVPPLDPGVTLTGAARMNYEQAHGFPPPEYRPDGLGIANWDIRAQLNTGRLQLTVGASGTGPYATVTEGLNVPGASMRAGVSFPREGNDGTASIPNGGVTIPLLAASPIVAQNQDSVFAGLQMSAPNPLTGMLRNAAINNPVTQRVVQSDQVQNVVNRIPFNIPGL